MAALALGAARGQSVHFDFDNAPLHGSLPLDLTSGGVTAHFSASPAYYNYSIQRADVLGFTPAGFAGYCIYPNTVYACDLLVSFDHPLNAASILYAPEEYATDSSCTMRMTAYLGSTFVGTNTYQIQQPGTWPTGTLSFSSMQPFDHLVIHYDQPPPTGGDYGPIFMADNLLVTTVLAPTPSAAASRKSHGAVGDFDINLPLTGPAGIECRSGGATGDYSLVVTFANPVTLANTPQAEVTSGTATIGTGGIDNGGTVSVDGATVTVPLTNVSNAQTISVALRRVNDGTHLGDVTISMSILVGDINENGIVSSSDIAETKALLGQPLGPANCRADVSTNGAISSSDVSMVKASTGTGLP